ncbi:MAG TPA: amidohydrolase family protein [Burkholderiales bacterium]|nr:amidohydrolase family protein [Burkholderiales bacterium]
MLFTCAPRSCAAVRTADRKVVKRGNKSLAVDLHCHVQTPEADALAKQTAVPHGDPVEQHGSKRSADRQKELRTELDAKLTSVAQRLKDMDKMGIDVQAISTSPSQYFYRIEPELGQQTSRLVNENLASIVAGNPDRFVALGTVPMQEPKLAVKELEYCMKELGFRGLEIGTNVRKVELSDPRFNAFWAKAEALGAVIFLHPSGFTDRSRMTAHFLTNVVGNPLDTTFALSHIVFGGVLERHPRLKIVAAHGGGYLGGYPARMDHAYRVRPECHDFIKRPPSYYMKKIYYDTMVFGEPQLEHLVNLYGADHIVIGTDYPYDMGYYKPVGFVEGAKLTRAQKDRILGMNAAKLLGLKRR